VSNKREQNIFKFLDITYGSCILFENETSFSISGFCVYFKNSKQVGFTGDGKYYSVMKKWFYEKYNLGN